MNQTNQTLDQRMKNLKNSDKAQAWKTAVAAALGLTAGAGVAYAITADDVDPVPDPAPIDGEEEDVQVVEPKAAEQTVVHNHIHQNAPAAPAGEAHADTHHEAVSLPGYTIFSHEVYTDENGSHVDVAFGITDNDHLCAIYDQDMDGIANTFFEDKNDSGIFSESEGINLQANDLVVSMNHLPGDEVVTETQVVVEDLTVIVGDTSEYLEGHEVIDADTAADNNLPDYTNDTDLAQNDDLTDISGINEYMA